MTVLSHSIARRPAVVLLLLAFGWLAGCAARAPRPDSALEVAWRAHAERVGAVAAWRADGRVAIRIDQEGWTASFGWRQARDRFDIQLAGPFGQGVVELTGDRAGAELIQSDGSRQRAASADELLARQTGWRLPVAGLRHWILGLPAPDRPAERSLDESGRLAELRQDQWAITYDGYQLVDGLEMPRKMRLINGDVQVKLVVAQWRTTPP